MPLCEAKELHVFFSPFFVLLSSLLRYRTNITSSFAGNVWHINFYDKKTGYPNDINILITWFAQFSITIDRRLFLGWKHDQTTECAYHWNMTYKTWDWPSVGLKMPLETWGCSIGAEITSVGFLNENKECLRRWSTISNRILENSYLQNFCSNVKHSNSQVKKTVFQDQILWFFFGQRVSSISNLEWAGVSKMPHLHVGRRMLTRTLKTAGNRG